MEINISQRANDPHRLKKNLPTLLNNNDKDIRGTFSNLQICSFLSLTCDLEGGIPALGNSKLVTRFAPINARVAFSARINDL